jgi:hypothetical protein
LKNPAWIQHFKKYNLISNRFGGAEDGPQKPRSQSASISGTKQLNQFHFISFDPNRDRSLQQFDRYDQALILALA